MESIEESLKQFSSKIGWDNPEITKEDNKPMQIRKLIHFLLKDIPPYIK
jgi:hypothetical protein